MGLAVPRKVTETSDGQILVSKTNLLTQSNVKSVNHIFHCKSGVRIQKKDSAKSCPTLAIPWTVAYQVPMSMGFSREEYWSRLPFPFPGELPDPGIEPGSPALQADSLPTKLWGKPREVWTLKNWWFWTVILEKTLDSPLDCKGLKPDNPKIDQSWIFIRRTDAETEAPITFPTNVKS